MHQFELELTRIGEFLFWLLYYHLQMSDLHYVHVFFGFVNSPFDLLNERKRKPQKLQRQQQLQQSARFHHNSN